MYCIDRHIGERNSNNVKIQKLKWDDHEGKSKLRVLAQVLCSLLKTSIVALAQKSTEDDSRIER